MHPKVTPDLEAYLDADATDEPVKVVVELESGPEPPPDIEAMKEAFHRLAAPVEAAIRQAGGEILGEAWINDTLSVRVPPRRVAALAALDRVARIDLPHRLVAE